MGILVTILREIESVVSEVDENQMKEISNYFDMNKRIFVDGEGRSGLMGKAFAMRLKHLGYEVYVIGETVTPSLQNGDIFFAISGSGSTKFVVENAKVAKGLNCKVLSVTSKADSLLAKISDEVLIVPATTKYDTGEKRKSVQLLSSLFDQSVHIVLDGLCLMLSMKNSITNDMAFKQHLNLE
ncbi:6-phospho-3-hexuloisomerase [Thermoanaerobacter thermohydrosulfuricus]|nr:6-phospho-3-hexuloisomerase [Clostridia bacterium]